MIETVDLRERWRAVAPRWRTHASLIRRMTEPISRSLVDALGPVPGERWLDVAGGVGDPALLLAGRVGPAGCVVLTDFAPEMLDGARDAAGEARKPLYLVAAAAEALPAESVFDGATCRFGAMFFADPLRALVEIRSAVLPGGRLGLIAWAGPERNPYFTELQAAVRDTVPEAPLPDPDGPHVFRYSPPGKLAALVRRAGWIEVEERTVPFTMAAPIPLADLWGHYLSLSVELEALVEELEPERRNALRANLEGRVGPYFREGDLRMPAEARLVLARAAGERSRGG